MFGACAFSALIVASPANATKYSAEYVFGDSLSDRGNLDELSAAVGLPPHYINAPFASPPTTHGSFTNGDVSVQVLAKSLGLNADPSLWLTGFKDPAGLFGGPAFVPGTNYAVAGATAAGGAPGTDINLPSQVGAFLQYKGLSAPSSSLYVIDIGGNDVRNAVIYGGGLAAVDGGVNAELTQLTTLADFGAKKFLIVNVGNVGAIPEFSPTWDPNSATDAPLATQYSKDYDSALAAGLATLDKTLPGVTLDEFNLYAYSQNLLAHLGDYGLTNTTEACYIGTPFSAATSADCGANAQNIDSFVYWDQVHPTAKVQALWAQGMAQAIPEPSTWAMLFAGFAGLGLVGRRRHASARA